MDSDNHPLIDLNRADEETLTQLRGVGSRFARRIIAERPFETIDELKRVRGISEKDVERLRPFLSISPETPQPEEVPAAMAAPDSEEILTEPEAAETEAAATLPQDAIEEPESQTAESAFEAEDDAEATTKAETEPEVEEAAFEPIPAAETEEAAMGADAEAVPEELEPVAETPESPPATQPGYITSGRAIGLMIFSCIFTLILAIAITLGILSSLNRGQLTYASPSQVNVLQTQLNGLAIQSETLTTDLDGLRTRLNNLEALSGRVSDIEGEIASIQTDMNGMQTEIEATQAQYDELASQLITIDEEIETLRTQGNRFEGFLEGLRDLMLGLFPNAQE
jgi:ribosomal protein S13